MALGELVVKMSADIAQFQSDMGRAAHIAQRQTLAMRREFDHLKGALASVFAGVSVHAFTQFIDRTIEATDRLNDLRTRLGVTGQELIVLEGSALRGGVGLESISEVSTKLAKRLQEASTGSGDAANAFAALGIKVVNAEGGLKGVNETLREAGVKFAGFEDGIDKSALAVAAFGKGGDRLIPVIEGIAETEKRFKQLGITISEDVITQSDKFKDTMQDLHAVNEAQARQMIAQLLPTLQNLLDRYIDLKKEGTLLADVGRSLAFGLRAVFAIAIGTTAAFTALGKAIANTANTLSLFAQGEFKLGAQQSQANAQEIRANLAKQFQIVKDAFSDQKREVDNFDLMGDPNKLGRRQAPRIVDLAKMQGEAKQAADALAKLQEDQAKRALDALKNEGKRREALVELQHAASLLNETEYFNRRLAIAQQASVAEIKVLDAQIARQRDDVDKAPKNTKEYHEAVNRLGKSLFERNELEKQFQQFGESLTFSKAKSADEYRRAVEQLNIQLLELQGRSVEAAAARFSASSRGDQLRFILAEDEAALNTQERIQEGIALQAQFNEAKDKYAEIQARLAIDEERIQNSLRVGAIGQIDALNQLSAARRASTEEMDRQLDIIGRIAAVSPDSKVKLQFDQMRVSVEKLKTESDLLADKFNTLFSDSVASAFSDFVTGSKTAADAFKAFTSSVVKGISDIAAKQIAADIFGSKSAGGGVGGLLAGIFGGKSKYPDDLGVYGSTTDQTGGGGAGLVSAITGIWSKFVGSYDVGTPYVPRTGLAMIHQGERIIPASENIGGGNGMRVVQNFYITGATDKRSQAQIFAAASAGLQRTAARDT
jgi:hypothetical protein